MFDIRVKVESYMDDVKRRAERAKFEKFNQAAFAVMRTAKESLDRAPRGVASEPGEPPHTHRRQFLKRAIRYSANREGAIIGPAYSTVGLAGHIHEFGGQFGFAFYPERPFMRPALEANIDRFANNWSGAISR